MSAPYYGRIAPLAVPPECGAQAADWTLHAQGHWQWLGAAVYHLRLWAGPGFVWADYLRQPFVLALDFERRLAPGVLAERVLAEMRHQGRFSQAQAQSWLHTLHGVLEPAAAPLRLSAQHDGEGELRFARDGVFAGVVQDADFTRLFLGIWFHETSTMASWQMTQPTSSEAHPWP